MAPSSVAKAIEDRSAPLRRAGRAASSARHGWTLDPSPRMSKIERSFQIFVGFVLFIAGAGIIDACHS